MNREKEIIKVSIYGIMMNILLVIFKASVGFITNSIAIILDAVNNLTDVISAVVTIVGTKLAGKRADKEHPFGHGRIEYIASVVIAIIILLAGLTSVKESIEKIIHPVEAKYSIISLIIIVVAIIVKFIFSKYAKKVGKKINSQSLQATGTDAFMDSILSFSTLVTAIINLQFGLQLEGYVGILISIIILKASFDILRDTLNSLIGVRVDCELSKQIKEIIKSFDQVQGVYDLTFHNYGPTNTMGSAHIQIDEKMTAQEIDKLTRHIRYKVYDEYKIIMTIGIYAKNGEDEACDNIRQDLEEIINAYPAITQLHGFYVNKKEKTVSFDLIIDFKSDNPKKIRKSVIEEIKAKHDEYRYYVIVDNDFSE